MQVIDGKRIQLFKDPLVHFLLAGLVLFLIFNIVSPNKMDLDPKTVVVDREAILVHIQNTSKMFDPTIAAKKFDAMTEKEKEAIINDYIREEVMFRESVSLGLDKEDYVMRRRVIQKLDFITEDLIEQNIQLSDEAVNTYFEEHKDDYYVEPFVTLTHVYFNFEKHDQQEALKLAESKRDELNKNKVAFADAVKHGERFLYHVNYVERTYDYIQSHFGDEMTGQVFSLKASDTNWYGPFQSQYGVHLVMLSKKQEGRYPKIEEVVERVKQDFIYSEKRTKQEETIQRIIGTYDIEIKI